jgi:hypothetical protein
MELNLGQGSMSMDRGRKVIAAKVIPWENQYGIALVFERGNHLAYQVGDREEAARQVQLARQAMLLATD